uniref:NADH-ubiquinone oxidoreductase chain 2 n=1 Tax=Atractomorpha sinensis TaxID=244711 RepID=B8PWI8_9ORTH|nr:NADH dehydrogenase subunit 2 [Atractomorpha sinensis]ABX11505.1 NADH dehydrogenase subunit 2 [Atractomorpha sinensis]
MTINLKKILFLSSLMMGSFISISSNSWFGVWMGLEMNLLSFIPLMVNDKNMMINESSIKYFIVQALASTMLLFSVLMILMKMPVGMEKKMIPSILISSSLMIKMGAAPFHYWFPEVMKTASWTNCLILMTWQKLAPMTTISYCNGSESFMITIIVTSIVIGAIGGLNQTYLRQIMAYSSITHVGWMIGAIMINESSWELYFIVYSILSSVMVMMFNQSSLININQVFLSSNLKMETKLIIMMTLLSMGGLPLTLGFLPKWVIFQFMMDNNLIALITMMVTMTTITLFYYIRLGFSSMIFLSNELKSSTKMSYLKFNHILPTLVMVSNLGLVLTASLIFTIL